MTDSYHSIIEPIIFTASRLEAIADRCLFRPIGINISSVKIMGLLCHKKIMTPKEILELAGGTKSNISQRLNFLEKKGYIKTQKNTFDDKRKLSITLTPIGKAKLKEMQKHIHKVKLELESNFTKKEIEQHFAFFNKLNKLVNAEKKDFPKCNLFCK
ncbi:MAG: transcriptional regulator [Candidatus Moraniibacteriota bacterium]